MLEVKGLTHSFGGLRAVDDFNLSVPEGAVVGIIGPNGAGKTTVFNLITGIYTPEKGEIRFDGHRLVGLPPHRINRMGVARTFQNLRLFNRMTVAENVRVASLSKPVGRTFGRKQWSSRDELITHLLDRVGLLKRASDLAGSLPYGEQRKLEIARALATQPRLLLLDEPAAGMNPSEVSELATLLLDLRSEFGLTIVLIEHRMDLVIKLCERITVMDFGKVIWEGPPAAAQRDPRVIEAYLGEEEATR